MGKIEVSVYCDSTGLFSEAECNVDNICDMMFDESIVERWFEEKISPDVEYGFELWFTEEYTCDDTDGLYQYAINYGDNPVFDIDGKYYVFYMDDYDSMHIIFEGSCDECRRFGKKFNWFWGNENEYELEVM